METFEDAFSIEHRDTPRKFNIAPEKWWLEDYFPIGKVTFQVRTVKLREGNPLLC